MNDFSPWLYVSTAILWLAFLGFALTLLGLIRLVTELQNQVQSLAVLGGDKPQKDLTAAKPVPEFTVETLSGYSLTSDDLKADTYVLTFVSPGCPSCEALLYELEDLAQEFGRKSIVVVCRGDSSQCERVLNLHNLPLTVSDNADVLRNMFGVTSSPTLLVAQSGSFSFHGYAARKDELRELLKSARQGLEDQGLAVATGAAL